MSQSREDPKKRVVEIASKYDKQPSEWLSLDIVTILQLYSVRSQNKLKESLAMNWNLDTVAEGASTCLVLNTTCVKAYTVSAYIHSCRCESFTRSVCVHVYVNNKRVAVTYFNIIFFSNNKLERRPHFENVLIHYNDTDAAVFSTR